MKAKAGGRGKPFQEETVGDNLHRATGKWNRLRRLIDRRKDRYVEHIVDGETGEVIRAVDKPLSEHRGRGSARLAREPQDRPH